MHEAVEDPPALGHVMATVPSNGSQDAVQTWAPSGNHSNTTDTPDAFAIGATIMSPITMCLAGVVGNVLALVVLYRTRTEIRRMMFYTLVAGLAWTDLAGILLTSPFTIAAYINRRRMPGGPGLCKFNAFIMVCFGLSTPLIVTAMAMERFLAIKATYFYSKYCTPYNARVTLLVLWGVVFLFGALPLFGFGDYSVQYPATWCFLDFHTQQPLVASYGYLYAVLNLTSVVVMTFCNVCVMVTLLRVRYYRRQHRTSSSICSTLLPDTSENGRRSQEQQQLKRKKQRDVEMQMIWLMCAITTVFAACWAPLMVHIIWTLATTRDNPVFGLTAVRLASLNQTLDPWLYILLRKAFLDKVRDRLRSFLSLRPRSRESSEGKCNQYVHVRRQLCHRNHYVGNSDPRDLHELRSGSMRRSHSCGVVGHSGVVIPDVMQNVGAGGSRRTDSMPDVTKSRVPTPYPHHMCGRGRTANNDVHGGGARREESTDNQEGIYVDIFRLLPPSVTTTTEDSTTDQLGDGSKGVQTTEEVLTNEDEGNSVLPDCSTSGVFSISPRLAGARTKGDKSLHSDVTPCLNVERPNARRTKSYT